MQEPPAQSIPAVIYRVLQLAAQNAFNTLNPAISLTTYRPTNSALAGFSKLWQPLPAFGPWAAAVAPGPGVPPGRLTNAILKDRAGAARVAAANAPGAYCRAPSGG